MKFYSLNKTELAKVIFANSGSKNNDNVLVIDNFSDGEFQPIYKESVRKENLFIMMDGHTSNDIIKICLTLASSKRSGCKSIILICPYIPYMRADKLKNHIRSCISIRTFADILNASGGNKLIYIITIELHNLSIVGMFDTNIIHLNGNKIFIKYVKSLNIDNMCICSPDAGAVERSRDFAKAFPNSVSALIEKKRVKFNEIDSMILIGEENIINKNVLIIDDIVDTFGTIKKSSILLKDKGAITIRAIASHAVLSGNALKNLYESAITELIVSDTINTVYEKVELYNNTYNTPNIYGIIPKITIISCADIISESINRLNNKKSINDLNLVS